MPRALTGKFGQSSSGPITDCLSALICNLSLEEAQAICADPDIRAAAGASDIWATFPEVHGFFSVEIERAGAEGVAIMRSQLQKCIPGDVLVGTNAIFESGGTHWLGKEKLVDWSSISLDEDTIYERYPFFFSKEDVPDLDVHDFTIFICEGFSIFNIREGVVSDGVYFYNARQFIDKTNILNRLSENRSYVSKFNSSYPEWIGSGIQEVVLPDFFSGIFLCSENNSDYGKAVIQRIFSAASAVCGARAKVSRQMRLTPNAWSNRSRLEENWYFPFGKRIRGEAPSVFNAEDGDFGQLISLIRNSTVQKFQSAKEDFRVLALETAADGRHSEVAGLQFAQTWMAIEKLLPFRGETTVQLALALVALFPALERPGVFKRIKDLYALRSDIVHGYKFKRGEEIYDDIKYISEIFRNLLSISLRFDGQESLKDKLFSHALSGNPEAFSA